MRPVGRTYRIRMSPERAQEALPCRAICPWENWSSLSEYSWDQRLVTAAPTALSMIPSSMDSQHVHFCTACKACGFLGKDHDKSGLAKISMNAQDKTKFGISPTLPPLPHSRSYFFLRASISNSTKTEWKDSDISYSQMSLINP